MSATPSLSGIFYICEYLGITPAEFFDFDNKNPARLNKINMYLKKLNAEQLEIIEKLAKIKILSFNYQNTKEAVS